MVPTLETYGHSTLKTGLWSGDGIAFVSAVSNLASDMLDICCDVPTLSVPDVNTAERTVTQERESTEIDKKMREKQEFSCAKEVSGLQLRA